MHEPFCTVGEDRHPPSEVYQQSHQSHRTPLSEQNTLDHRKVIAIFARRLAVHTMMNSEAVRGGGKES